MSQRTDGGPAQAQRDLTGGDYGDGKDFREIQSGAPMAKAPSAPPMGAGQIAVPQAAPPIGLGAPTQRPEEALTTGNERGPGAGPEVLSGGTTGGNLSQQTASDVQNLKQYLPALEARANMPGTPASFVRFVKYLRSS